MKTCGPMPVNAVRMRGLRGNCVAGTGALARPSARAQKMSLMEPSLTVGLVPRSASTRTPTQLPPARTRGSGDKHSCGIVACDTFAGEIAKTAGKEFSGNGRV